MLSRTLLHRWCKKAVAEAVETVNCKIKLTNNKFTVVAVFILAYSNFTSTKGKRNFDGEI